MGKYSLENYERYKMIKCRPQEVRANVEGAGLCTFATVRVTPGGDTPALSGKTLLEVHVPDAMCACMETAESSLRRLASKYYRHPLVLGVTVITDTNAANCRRLWEAAAQAFAPKRYIVPVTDGEQLDYMLKHALAGGLLADVQDHPYDVCEAFAENDAQKLYQQMPVLVRFAHAGPGEERFAAQWHAAAVEGADAPAGHKIALRRLTLPKALSCGGFAPMRFWWTNKGTSYCHERVTLRLRLVGGGVCAEIPVHDCPERIWLADRVHNEIVRLPEIAPGTYSLEYGLFTQEGEGLVLANDGAAGDGFYTACEVTLDDVPRPEYETIWNDFFPDGYYPLEDPKEPV